uniref:Uncharacterized protein n=1 Tax=Anguilla anguilla TaxID=7936 RepID=A0A0E9PZ97_ANGAN
MTLRERRSAKDKPRSSVNSMRLKKSCTRSTSRPPRTEAEGSG